MKIKIAKRFVARPHTRKRAAVLTVVCLIAILGSVALLNLQVPLSSRQPLAVNTAAVASLRYHVAPGQAQPPSVPSGIVVASPQPAANLIASGDVDYLRSEGLKIPVAGVSASQLRDSFTDGRSEGRQHEAIDIAAPRGTPVLAAADGTIARLFQSRLGGTTLYEYDRSGRFVFYYAHLSGYADGVAEGKAIRKGEVFSYAGNTGNAGTGNFHLHFAISKLTTPWKWSGGEAIDPYPLLGGKAAAGN